MSIRPGDPHTHAEMRAAYEQVHREVTAYWRSLPLEVFLAPIGEKWSPLQNVRHLTMADRQVTRAFAAPEDVLVARFGRPERASRSFVAIATDYLAQGNRLVAPPPLVPAAEPADGGEPLREAALAEADEAAAAWLAALDRWSDESLDRVQLPHPLMQMLTLREFAGWAVQHHAHHANTVRRLLRAARQG